MSIRKSAVLFALTLLLCAMAAAQSLPGIPVGGNPLGDKPLSKPLDDDASLQPKLLAMPKNEIFIGYAYQHADTTGSGVVDNTNLNGFAVGFSHYLHGSNFGFTLDLSHGSNSRVDSTGIHCSRSMYLAGPSYRFHNVGFLTANVHALVGASKTTFEVPYVNTQLTSVDTNFAAAAGFAVDGNLSRHLAVRLGQVDYVYTNHNNGNQNSFRYAGGVLFRF